MLKLDFSAIGYAYERELLALQDAYGVVARALAVELQSLEDQAAAYHQQVIGGGEVEEERDEEGHLLWERGALFELEIESRQHGLMEVRKAALTIYHSWESRLPSCKKGQRRFQVAGERGAGKGLHRRNEA